MFSGETVERGRVLVLREQRGQQHLQIGRPPRPGSSSEQPRVQQSAPRHLREERKQRGVPVQGGNFLFICFFE